jgi:hypothetical protein
MAGVCAFAQSMARWTETHPDVGMVFASTCDQLRRTFDTLMLTAPERIFLFNVPATWQSPVACSIFRAELERLGNFCLRLGGRVPTGAQLSAALREHEYRRQLLRAAAPHSTAHALAEAVAHFHWTGEARPPGRASQPQGGVPIALLGSPLPASHWRLLDFIESVGGRVALNATEAGERSLLPTLPDDDKLNDPMETLARIYLDHGVDAFQRPNTRLYDWLRAQLAAREIRGLVLWSYGGCDLWRAETQSLREAFGRPVLALEADENPDCLARETGRLQAFVEMLR